MKVKICGLRRREDALAVNEAGADFAGFVFADSPRRVTEEEARQLKKVLSPGIGTVGVFVDAPLEQVARLLGDGLLDFAQLHGGEDEGYQRKLSKAFPGRIIKSYSIAGEGDMKTAAESPADFILLDHGTGGTGKSFDWSLIRDLDRPFFLAGGITPENVTQAVKQGTPYAIDASSGVETGGVKDRMKILELVGRIRND